MPYLIIFQVDTTILFSPCKYIFKQFFSSDLEMSCELNAKRKYINIHATKKLQTLYILLSVPLVRCNRNSKYLERCLKDSLESLRIWIFYGCVELNIKSYEPYRVIEHEDAFSRSPFKDVTWLKDVVIEYLSRYDIVGIT